MIVMSRYAQLRRQRQLDQQDRARQKREARQAKRESRVTVVKQQHAERWEVLIGGFPRFVCSSERDAQVTAEAERARLNP